MKVEVDYQKGEAIIISDDRSVCIHCKVRSADSDYSGELRLRRGATERVHICRDAASGLLPILQRYVDTGKAIEDEYHVRATLDGYIICNPKGERVCEVWFPCSHSADKVCETLNMVTRAKGENK
jgi:hypothetical protein